MESRRFDLRYLLRNSHCTLLTRAFAIALGLIGPYFGEGQAAELKKALVSQVIKDVNLLPAQAAPRPAAVRDEVHDGTAVRTGVESRAELTFTDETIARLGANTIFSFQEGTRNLELGGGAMLVRVPKNSGGAQISTAAVTAAITGTTVLLEYHANAYIKFIVLEGTGRMFRKGHAGESVLVQAGQMLIVNPTGNGLPDPVDVDLNRLRKTSRLITGFGPLPSGDLIAQAIGAQDGRKKDGELIETNLVIFGGGTTVALVDPTQTSVLDQANAMETRRSGESPSPSATPSPSPSATPTASPSPSVTPTPSPSPSVTPTATPSPSASPTPDKFGTPPVIASSTPYEITGDTVIATDPTITTNGTTNFGTIYRGAEQDGSASRWLFGSTSAFDNSIGFDENFFIGDRAPLAAFKFSALRLIGNPSIVIGDGGPANLALVSVGDLTSGPPGGILTFSNLHLLFLATQDGSITLTSNLVFQDIPVLGIYARGAGSILTFDASIFGTTELGLLSEGDIRVTDSLTVNQTNDAGLTEGMTISLIAGQTINVGRDLSLSLDASGIASGGMINIVSGGDTTIGGLFGLTISGFSGTIGNGGSIFASTGGNLTVGSLDFFLDYNVKTASISNGANIELSVGANLITTAGGVDMLILTPFDNSVDNGGNLSLSVGEDLLLGENNLSLRLVTSRGTQLGTGANLTASVGGNFASNNLTARIENNRFGQIGTGGNLFFSVGSDLAASKLLLQLDNSGNGNIDLGGNITLSVGNDVTISGNADFFILNSDSGHIGTGGNILVSTGGDFSASTLNAMIDNSEGGSIDEGGVITFNIGGALSTSGDASFEVLGDAGATSGVVAVNAGSIDVGGTLRAAGGIISAVGSVTANEIHAFEISAGGDITFVNPNGGRAGGLFANTTTAGGDLHLNDAQFLQSETSSTDGRIGLTPDPFSLGVDAIISLGPTIPTLLSQGADAVAGQLRNNPGNGGLITLNLNAAGLTIGSANDLAGINANGGAFLAASTAGGNGGTVDITAIGDVSLIDRNITATSGTIPSGGRATLGSGGTVNITTAGTISVASTIQTSSDDVEVSPARHSATGGHIALTSTKATGTAINISNSGQLLALLDAAAPGPGGTVTIVATGAGSTANVQGNIQADRGTVDIHHDGNNGTVNISGVGGNNSAFVRGDIVKIGALGNNGILTIGQGTLSADTTLKLYANGSNGQIQFVDNVTIGGGSATIIAGNTITINDNKVVTVTGTKAGVFTFFDGKGFPNANYTGSGGNGSTSGMFGGLGANNPQPLRNAPPYKPGG